MACGGYSVVGSSVFTPLKDKESKQMEQRLDEVRRNLIKTRAKKAEHAPWLNHFMEEEGELELVAFLSLWLARFVFPRSISKQFFPIAIHLARGTRIALAPAVLASIYRDLTLLKGKFVVAVNSVTNSDDECGISAKPIILRAHFQLVQIWAFERFPSFQLRSTTIEHGQPLTTKWHQVRMLNYEDVSLALDSSAKSFLWQPYKDASKFYSENDRWVCFNSDSNVDFESFARCLRHSELLGMDCVEMYLPHRVAMQFGLDQDIPEKVVHCKENDNPKIAWRNYDRSMTEAMLCIAAVASSSNLEPGVTFKYLKWWKQSKLGSGERPGLSSKSTNVSEKLSQTSSEMGSPIHRDQTGNNSDQNHDGSTIKKLQKRSHSHETDISMVDGQSKRAKLDAKMESVIDKSENAKEGKFGENGNERECVSDWSLDIYFSSIETRLEYLERLVAQLKAEKFGPKYGVVRAKTSLS